MSSVFKVALKIIVLINVGLMVICSGAPGVGAQAEPLTVTLTNLESQNFPEITAWVTVTNAGQAVDGLAAENFEIVEDDENGGPLAAAPVTVEADSLQNLRLVLAIDTSTTDMELAETKAAAITMINRLGAGDRAALLSFGDVVNLEYNFTNNTTALQSAISRLSPKGKKTALHQAVVDAAAMLNKFEAGRKAAVVITNSYDNTGSPTSEQVATRLQQTQTPLYVIGLGKKVQGPAPLKTQTVSTGGQFLALNKTDLLQNSLLELEILLRQGYKISFHSGIKVDNLSHNFSINLSGSTGTGSVTGRFVAIPGKIVITPQGIAANQTVKGKLNLATEVVSPSPLVAVSYLLDDQLLATVSTLPYSFVWDTTTASPGSHVLTIQAEDQAGNKTQVGLTLIVVSPVQVTLSAARTEIELGRQAAVQVKVESVAEIAKMDLLVGDKVLDSKSLPPYQFSLDSSQYEAGTYPITVRATDNLGRVAEDQLEMTFVTPPSPPGQLEQLIRSQRVQSGLLVAAAGLAGLAAMLLAGLLLIMMSRVYRNRSRRQTRLEIVNLGNIQSRYSLAGKDAQGSLNFQFALQGATLPLLSPQFLTSSGAAGDVASAPLPLQPMAATPVDLVAPVAVNSQTAVNNGAKSQNLAAQSRLVTDRFQTPFIEPSETLWVDMLINPHKPYKKETCSFEVISQAIDQTNAPRIKNQGLVEVGGVFWGWRFLSYLLVVLTMSWVIWQIFSLTLWRLLEVDTGQLLSLMW